MGLAHQLWILTSQVCCRLICVPWFTNSPSIRISSEFKNIRRKWSSELAALLKFPFLLDIISGLFVFWEQALRKEKCLCNNFCPNQSIVSPFYCHHQGLSSLRHLVVGSFFERCWYLVHFVLIILLETGLKTRTSTVFQRWYHFSKLTHDSCERSKTLKLWPVRVGKLSKSMDEYINARENSFGPFAVSNIAFLWFCFFFSVLARTLQRTQSSPYLFSCLVLSSIFCVVVFMWFRRNRRYMFRSRLV